MATRYLTVGSILLAWFALGCSSSDDSTGSGGATSSGGSTSSGGGSGGSGASSSGGGGSTGTGATSGSSCADLGGQCQCAGGCNTGFHSAGELDCPQPCEGCGACSQWCCVPDATDAGADGG